MLGYDVDPKGGRLVVNEREAKAVRAIFQAYLDHGSLLATVRELDRRGIRTKRWTTRRGSERGGKPWDKARLRYLLKSPIYMGKVTHRDLFYPGEHEPIVSEEVWERVQERFRRNGKGGQGAVRNKHDALLAGLLWCVSCGTRMTPTHTQRGDRRYRYYLCRHAQAHGRDRCPTKTLPAAEIERFVVERLRALGSDAKFRTEVLAKARAEWRARVAALAEIRDETAALSAEQMKGSEVVPALETLAARWETLPQQDRSRIAPADRACCLRR
jgi:site-specific DNA recombinase